VSDFDFVVIGAGAAGEAAAHEARRRGATVAIVDRELFGGSCPFWACMPSKALLHAALVRARGTGYPWDAASRFRDWVISREGRDWPDDAGHVKRLRDAGAQVIRGDGRIVGLGRVHVDLADGGWREVSGRFVVVAIGSCSTVPDIPGLNDVRPWTNREATSTRERPRSLAILGGGPTGIEMAQVFARYDVPVAIVQAAARLNDRDHPLNSEALATALRADGVELHLGRRAERVEASAGRDGAHRVHLDDGSTVEGHELMLSIGRTVPLDGLGLDAIGVHPANGRLNPDDQLRIADDTFVIGDPAGPEMHTHLAHYQGEIVVAVALGDDVRPDYRAIPRVVYTDPPTAGVGLQLGQAREQGIDAFEKSIELASTAVGQANEAAGHVTIVLDRGAGTLAGAFMSGPGAPDAIHMAVLAIKTRTPISILADTITAFPTTSRVMGGLFVEAARELRAGA
jgi:dihydrolipoamide dehydrogenase